MIVCMTLLVGVFYPLFITVVSDLIMTENARGSLIKVNEKIIGSRLIAQKFVTDAYFWPRPSATDYKPLAPAGGSNLGPTSKKLKEQIAERIKTLKTDPMSVPAELVYASGSGLDPEITERAAYFQITRIAKARGITNLVNLKFFIDSLVEEYGKGYLNVLLLNIALDKQFPLVKHEK